MGAASRRSTDGTRAAGLRHPVRRGLVAGARRACGSPRPVGACAPRDGGRLCRQCGAQGGCGRGAPVSCGRRRGSLIGALPVDGRLVVPEQSRGHSRRRRRRTGVRPAAHGLVPGADGVADGALPGLCRGALSVRCRGGAAGGRIRGGAGDRPAVPSDALARPDGTGQPGIPRGLDFRPGGGRPGQGPQHRPPIGPGPRRKHGRQSGRRR